MENISRRSFVGMAAGMAGAMGVVAAPLVVDVSRAEAEEAAEPVDHSWVVNMDTPWAGPGSASGDWNGTPEDQKALGNCTMPLDELNRRRRLYVDSKTEHVCGDGTVIPEVFVKVRALLNTYGFGVANAVNDRSFDWILLEMDEEEAQAYLEMPLGVKFEATEFAIQSGRSIEDCKRICDALFQKAWLGRIVNEGGIVW